MNTQELEQIKDNAVKVFWESKYDSLSRCIDYILTEALAPVERERDELKESVDVLSIEYQKAEKRMKELKSSAAKVREDTLREAYVKLGKIVDNQTYPCGTLSTMAMCIEAVQSLITTPATDLTDVEFDYVYNVKPNSNLDIRKVKFTTPASNATESGCGLINKNGYIKTACGTNLGWQDSPLTDGSNWKFCPYCGKTITQGTK